MNLLKFQYTIAIYINVFHFYKSVTNRNRNKEIILFTIDQKEANTW